MAEKRRRGIFRSREGEPASDGSSPDETDAPEADVPMPDPDVAEDLGDQPADEISEEPAEAEEPAEPSAKRGAGKRMMNWLGYGLDDAEKAGTEAEVEPEPDEPQTEVQPIPEAAAEAEPEPQEP